MTNTDLSWRPPRRRGNYLEGATGASRLIGIDAARGLALVGMMAAHIGVTTWGFVPSEGLVGWLGLAHGRPSILFAVVGGFSLGILSGRVTPHHGEKLVHTRLRVLVRATLLLVVGALLDLLGTDIAVILGHYATWFAFALPFLRWPVRRLFALAGVIAVIGPVLHLYLPDLLDTWGFSPWLRSGNSALTDFLLTGSYPGVVWMAYIFTGLALARLEWDSVLKISRLLGAGVMAMIAGYGGSALALRLFAPDWPPEAETDWATIGDLLNAEPHADTFFEALGSGGVAVTVIAVFMLIARYAAWTLAPLAAVGSMSLTVYSLHIVWVAALPGWPETNAMLAWMALTFIVFAMVWKFFFGRGPFEHWMYVVTVKATRTRETPVGLPAAPTAGLPAAPTAGLPPESSPSSSKPPARIRGW
ncbi:MAG TPA: heparan-alpha-glucosaminide N-acetyltransferase domain-containing protein [Actinomycetaceae bacterium]|nr:heparan-alpha-glucosaminide N-acetyltransferase domain-containing protein [Actinomycetaceae bacterium]